MPNMIPPSTLEKFTTFGDLLRYLRRRAGITQTELSIAVGYSISQISRLEQNLRLPDLPTIQARFIQPLCLEDEPKTVARLLELAAAIRREDAPALGLCPYKGLDYFDEADADLFVGRESLTDKLVHEVVGLASEKPQEGRFYAVVGASGSGKSSLVRAGLIPTIRWKKEAANWQIHILTPTAHPLESLATALTRESSLTATAQFMDDLAGERRALSLFIKREQGSTGATYFLLIIDQFEELFALCHSINEQSAFIDNLLTAAFEEGGKAIIVITLRADFYAYCANYLQLRQALARHQEYIGAMSDEEMRRAIEEPARRGRWDFEEGLVDLILHDVGHEPGALPLLSHALLETWQRRQGRTLTLSGYISSGGVRGAIAETAEMVFSDQFNHEQQAIARRIFLRLTELGDETATGDTRRRATINELIIKPEESDATQQVLKALADARLVTTSEDSVQVAHEVLIREWPTLRGWLEDNREGLRLHRQLTDASQEWIKANHDPGILFRGARLAQAGEWAAFHSDDMNILEREFLEASTQASEREAGEREVQRLRELESAQRLAESETRSSKKLRRRAIYLSLALAGTVILVILAVIFARQSEINAQLARSEQRKADSASTMAINESIAHETAEAIAVKQRSTADAASTQAIDQANTLATAEARAEAESRINLSLSLASAAKEANNAGRGDLALALAQQAVSIDQPPEEVKKVLRDIALSSGTRAVFSAGRYAIQSVAISRDGNLGLVGSCAQIDSIGACQVGELSLWDLQALKEVKLWSAHSGYVTAVAISLDGQMLISGGEDGLLILWNLDGELVAELGTLAGRITGLEIVPTTGNLLSSTADGMLALWDLASRQKLMEYDSTNSPINDIYIAEKTQKAVSGQLDGSVMMWDLTSPHPLFRVSQGECINAVALNQDASKIFLTMGGNIGVYLRMLDGKDGAQIESFMIATTNSALALSPDETFLLVPVRSNLVRFNINRWSQQGNLWGPEDDISAIVISQDGRLAITGSVDGELRVWNLGDQLDIQKFNLPNDGLTALDVSPDGKYLALSDAGIGDFNQPALWDIAQSTIVTSYLGFDGLIVPGALKFSQDGQYLAVTGARVESSKPVVMIWDVKSGAIICQREDFQALGRAVAFSPDGAYLLAGSEDQITEKGELILYNVKTCQVERVFDPQGDVTTIVFSVDGKRVITGAGYYGRIILWDLATATEIKRFTYPFKGPTLGIAFGPGETTILGAAYADLYLWDVETGNILQSYIGHSPFPWFVDLSPDNKYVLSGAFDGSLILWDFATAQELYRYYLPDAAHGGVFSPDSSTVYAVSGDGTLIQWRIAEKTLPELMDWIQANRYERPLTCEEKLQFHVDPQCKP